MDDICGPMEAAGRAGGDDDKPPRRYVDGLRIDRKPVSRNRIGHEELMRGARLDFRTSARPRLRRGTQAADAPYSFSTDPAARGR